MEKPKPKTPNLGQLVTSLKKRIEQIERDLRTIKDTLNTKDNWHAEIKDWIGQLIDVQFRHGAQTTGTLQWVDRYNVCIVVEDEHNERRICTKGGIDYISRTV